MDMSVSLDIPPGIATLKKPEQVLEAWQEHAVELADIEHQRVYDRTPVRTGALKSSVASHANLSESELVEIYYDDQPQLNVWERVYAQYQEGEPLGLHTYTNPPREMLGRADPEDIPNIQAWAETYARRWADGLGEVM